MPVLGAVRRRGSNSGLGAVTKGTPLRAVLSHPCYPHPANQDVSAGRRAATALSSHMDVFATVMGHIMWLI
eukprot:107421-Chlamydomonas_euryale.AAC.12